MLKSDILSNTLSKIQQLFSESILIAYLIFLLKKLVSALDVGKNVELRGIWDFK